MSYPVWFDNKNICVHCGAENSLFFLDKFGKKTKNSIYPLVGYKCSKCDAEYKIYWQKGDNGKYYPSPIDPDIIDNYVDMVKEGDVL